MLTQREIEKEKKEPTDQEEVDTAVEENKEEEAMEELSETEALRKEMEEMKNLAQRTQADFVNYKKRVEKEKKDISAFANEKIMEELLEVIDNFSRALQSGAADEMMEDGKMSPFYQGVEMIFKQLLDKLGKFGLQEIEALGTDFDPNFHHAVMQVEGEEPDKVTEVLQKGYMLKEKVVRPAMVKVSK